MCLITATLAGYQCPSKCKCKLTHSDDYGQFLKVDCNNQGLFTIPRSIPQNRQNVVNSYAFSTK